jgi:hypothetical protein
MTQATHFSRFTLAVLRTTRVRLLWLFVAVVLSGCAQLLGDPFDKEFVVAQRGQDGGIGGSNLGSSCESRGAECGEFYDEALGVVFKCGGCPSNSHCVANRCVCEKKNCDQLEAECGYKNSGCNQLLNCGSCEDEYPNDPNKAFCSAEGRCGEAPVLPSTCEELRDLGHAAECGTVGVGELTLDCGTCAGRELCINNRCEGYEPLDCDELTAGGLLCGTFPDGAGDEITCACGEGERCTRGNICCTPRTECPVGSCGVISDGCGGTVDCGGCADGESCTDNVCCGETVQCPPGACGAQITVCGKTLDCTCPDGECCVGAEDGMGTCRSPSCPTDGRCGDGLPDGCGGTIDDCQCPGGLECGELDMCECVPRACPTDGTCGRLSDGCGGFIECFVCSEGMLCNDGECCKPSCPADGSCGLVSNGCGGQIMCGCGEGEACIDQQCVTPECPDTASCGVNVVSGVALSCRGSCPNGETCVQGVDGTYACEGCSAECPPNGACGLQDLGCTTLSCSGTCGVPGQQCVNRKVGNGPDNFTCCTPGCPNVNQAICGKNPDPSCGGLPADCMGVCPGGQRCVPGPGGPSCVTPTCPANPVCGENTAVQGGVIQCWGSCSEGQDCVGGPNGTFQCACRPIQNPCAGRCGIIVSDGCSQSISCLCGPSNVCSEGMCCTPTAAGTACAAADAECGAIEEPTCGATVQCGTCTGDQRCIGNHCACDPTKCDAHESCNMATETCQCDSAKCPAGQACTNAGVCACDSSQCPTGETCNAQGQCACQAPAASCGVRVCGQVTNACGQATSCGTCPAGQTCNAQGQCDCQAEPPSCGARACGEVTNACGETIQCGSCPAGQECNAQGQCVCEAAPPSCDGKTCGEVTNACGETIQCGTCDDGEECVANQCVCSDTADASAICMRVRVACGPTMDGCQRLVACPACAEGFECQNGECVPTCTETPTQACVRLGYECGAPPANARTECDEPLPASCGTCEAPETCENNQCTCIETACDGRSCGLVRSSCSDEMISCGPCAGTCSEAGVCLATPPLVVDGGVEP